MPKSEKYFTSQLLHWNKRENNRAMPWKGEKDPYRIWLSEIILQQTRVGQGWDYYDRFVAAFPTVEHLAKASETKVFKLWEGLGYYARCKNLISTAKIITKEYDGKFPDKYEQILALKGVGPYTAAAIASFAFNLPHPVLDGNVYRVLARFFGIDTAIDSIAGKKLFNKLAEELLDKKQPGIYNQAIMDFGAVVCKPKLPLCGVCPLKTKCAALLEGTIAILPVKEKTIINKNRWFYYFLIEHDKKIYLRKRLTKDIWQKLYEFVLVEEEKERKLSKVQCLAIVIKILQHNRFQILDISRPYLQQLTHQTIMGRFIRVETDVPLMLSGYKAVTYNQLQKLPFPKFITGYMAEAGLTV